MIEINHQPDATIFQFIILTFIYSSTCFGRSPAHNQVLNDCSSSLWFYLRIVVTVVLCSWSGKLARPRTQHVYHHDTKVKAEAATAVIELLMMGGRTPETCWAVNKRQDNKLENCCIWLVIYTMMHGLTNLNKSIIHGGTKFAWHSMYITCCRLASLCWRPSTRCLPFNQRFKRQLGDSQHNLSPGSCSVISRICEEVKQRMWYVMTDGSRNEARD